MKYCLMFKLTKHKGTRMFTTVVECSENELIGAKEERKEMKNYICINGKKIELTEEQIAQFSGADNNDSSKRELQNVPASGTFKIGEYEFIVLEHTDYGTAVLLKDLYIDTVEFGKNNNFDGSNVDKICSEFAKKIEDLIGEDNLLAHEVDLTSDDGLKDYGTIDRKVSLLTADLYRRYVYTIDKYKIAKWWWLSTPFSTKTHENDIWIKCVSPSGVYRDYYGISIGVRPFCILKSNIFVFVS